MSRTGVVVQARVGSNRLPGKVLMRLAGETVLAHVLRRAHAIEGIDLVCCAVPEGVSDDAVAEEALRSGADVFRGSEDDVLDRYERAAAAFGLDTVVRVTADCPLLDPDVCGLLLRVWETGAFDYVCNDMPPTWPHGLDCEVISGEWLQRSAREADAPSDREHVTAWVRRHPDACRANVAMTGRAAADHRWTLDRIEDLTFLRCLAPLLPAGPAGWDHRAVLEVVTAQPWLKSINAGAATDADPDWSLTG